MYLRDLPHQQALDHQHRARRPGQQCPVTPALADICIGAAQAVGGGVVAIDVLEDADGRLLVNEVNYTMEFRNSIDTTGVNIPARVIDYVVAVGGGEMTRDDTGEG